MDVLTQLSKLTSLCICLDPDMKNSNGSDIQEVDASYVMDLPGLRSLHMTSIGAKDLVLLCPELRSLTMDYPSIKGNLSLPASLEDLSMRGLSGPPMNEPYQASNLLGLTSLLCHASGPMEQDQLYAMLPLMSALKTFVLITLNEKLPPLLPASLQALSYILESDASLSSEELQHVAAACQLPELQSLNLYKCLSWKPRELCALQNIQMESKAKVILKEKWVDEDGIIMGQELTYYASRDMHCTEK